MTFVVQAIVLLVYPVGDDVDPIIVARTLTSIGFVCLFGEIVVRRSSASPILMRVGQ